MDTLFNTSLAYELPVLKSYVLPLLKGIDEDSPVFGEAQRLLSIHDFVPVIPSDDVPNLSIIREFIRKLLPLARLKDTALQYRKYSAIRNS